MARPSPLAVFARPLRSPHGLAMVAVMALCFVFLPQLPNNDWQRNIRDIPMGLAIYDNPAYVYPPWALLFFAPLYPIGAAGVRVVSVLAIGWLGYRRGWRLPAFFAVILSPLFIWTMGLSSADVLVFLLPVLLWEASRTLLIAGQAAAGGAAIALLLLKPQTGAFVVVYWLWTLRRQPHQLLLALMAAAAIMLPISAVGAPPLLAQWLDNVTHPVSDNLDHWVTNNLSLSYQYSLPLTLIAVAVAFGGLFLYLRRRGGSWTPDHRYSVLLASSMLIAPYSSNQGAIVPLLFFPSWRSTWLQWVGVIGAAVLNLYAVLDNWLLILFVIAAIAWMPRDQAAQSLKVEG